MTYALPAGPSLITTDTGVVLRRFPIYMEPSSWNVLNRLADADGTSGSKVIEKLVLLADSIMFKKVAQ